MKKGKLTMTITIGLVCFILVFVTFMQIKTVKETDVTSIENMREEELREQLASWKTKYEETDQELQDTVSKLNEYKEKQENNQEASELLDQELSKVNINLGKTNVQGEGVSITLKEGKETVKAIDIIRLLNELNLAEAEAICVNEERITNMSEVADVNSYIILNGQRLTAPFVIKAIGNQKYLESGLTAKGGYLDIITEEGKEVVVDGNKNIQIPKYNGQMEVKHMKY